MAKTYANIEDAVVQFKESISSLSVKTQGILANWLIQWSKYLKHEKTFDPSNLRVYKRGAILHVHFGFNVGCEIGGARYCVVVEKGNSINNPLIVVVPIYSLEHGKTEDTLPKNTVVLGEIIPDSPTKSYAAPLQIRAISKIRIIKPKCYTHPVYYVSDEYLDRIDRILISKITKTI